MLSCVDQPSLFQAIRSSFAALASEALRTLALAQRSGALATKASLKQVRRDSFDKAVEC